MGIRRVSEGRALARLLAVYFKVGFGREGATCVEIKILRRFHRRVVLHAIDATPARRRGGAGSLPLASPTHWLISTQGATQTIADRAGYSTGFKQQIFEPYQQPRPRSLIIFAVPPRPKVHQVIVVHHLGPLERHGDGRVEGPGALRSLLRREAHGVGVAADRRKPGQRVLDGHDGQDARHARPPPQC